MIPDEARDTRIRGWRVFRYQNAYWLGRRLYGYPEGNWREAWLGTVFDSGYCTISSAAHREHLTEAHIRLLVATLLNGER